MKIKVRIWEILEGARPGDGVGRGFVYFILTLIFLNVAAVIVGSVEAVNRRYGVLLHYFELFSVAVFTLEYALRVWSCTVHPEYARRGGRIRFLFKGMSLVDLLSILPFYLPFVGIDLRFLRALRLMRIIRIVKVARYYNSLSVIQEVVRAKKEELLLSSFILFLLLITSSCVMYYCENGAQPEAFSSIPQTMWWAVTTLTTVGYGDICPVTVLGRFFASVVSILGIGMFALPTGILGAGFVEAIQKRKSRIICCPHCGKELDARKADTDLPAGGDRHAAINKRDGDGL